MQPIQDSAADTIKTVRIRLEYERLEAMENACGAMADYSPLDEHEALLKCHLLHLKSKLGKILKVNQSIYTIRLEAPEALAFKQAWAISGRYQDRYTQVVIGALVNKITA